MIYGFFEKFFRFVGIFILVVIALYMDKLVIYPIKTIEEIFVFPWNLVVLTIMIYSFLEIVFKIKKAFTRQRY